MSLISYDHIIKIYPSKLHVNEFPTKDSTMKVKSVQHNNKSNYKQVWFTIHYNQKD